MSITNPYPGIRPFRKEDSQKFFGRRHLIDTLFRKLGSERFVAVVGSSGCGKSSLINAGLLPVVLSKGWQVVVVRPQTDPLANLANELKKLDFQEFDRPSLDIAAGAPGSTESFRQIWEQMLPLTLSMSSQGLIDTFRQTNSPRPLLLIVDQFEELLEYKSKGIDQRENAIKFINLLIEAAHQIEFPIHIVIVMRSDFLGHCAQFKGLPELINNGHFLIPRLTRDQYREAIIGPLNRYSIRIASNIVSQLLNDIEDDPDQLPILQHAMMLTFEEWRKKDDQTDAIDAIHYDASGGMMKSIDEHCNVIFNELKRDNLHIQTKIIFQRLTEVNLEGIGIRAPAKVSELMQLTGLDFEPLTKILNAFREEGRNFLFPSIEYPIHANTTIDLSHECIIRKWNLLQEWMYEEETDRNALLKLIEHYKNFVAGERRYLKGLTLSNYLRWRRFATEASAASSVWASRYSNEFRPALKFINDSRSFEGRRRSQSKLVKYALFFILLSGGGFWIYVKAMEAEKFKAEKDTLKAVNDTLSVRTEKLRSHNNYLIDSLEISKKMVKADFRQVWNDNTDLLAKNKQLSLRISADSSDQQILKHKYDSLSKLFQSLEKREITLTNLLKDTNDKSGSAMDSIIEVKEFERIAEVNNLKEEYRKDKSEFENRLRSLNLLNQNERAAKEYFADQFTEELKKNKMLLEEFEQRFETDFKNGDPILANSIRMYIDESKSKMSTILGNISRYHEIELYTYQQRSEERFDDFLTTLKDNGFSGKVYFHPVNIGFFRNAGIVILAKDHKIEEQLKACLKASKYRNKNIMDVLVDKRLKVPDPEMNRTIIILDL